MSEEQIHSGTEGFPPPMEGRYIRFVSWSEKGPMGSAVNPIVIEDGAIGPTGSAVNPIVIEDSALSLLNPSVLGPASAVHDSRREIDEVRSALQLEKSKHEVLLREAGELCEDLLDTQERWGRDSPLCPICMEKLCDYGVTQCGHRLCESCFYFWYHSTEMVAKSCPVCRATLDERHGKVFIKIQGSS